MNDNNELIQNVEEPTQELYKFKLEMEKGERSIVEEGTVSSKDLKKELGL